MQSTDLRDAAQTAATWSQSFINKQVDERSTRIGRGFGSVARDLQNLRRELGRRGAPSTVAESLSRGADSAARFGTYLQRSDPDRLVADLEDLVRRRPWEFASAALVLGFAAGRMLKEADARSNRPTGLARNATLGILGAEEHHAN